MDKNKPLSEARFGFRQGLIAVYCIGQSSAKQAYGEEAWVPLICSANRTAWNQTSIQRVALASDLPELFYLKV
ncbi:hypothetical protein ADIAL_1531 [Alkalibacterium sp. AK22]|nr:hypothetical protein ADIAL_1531 [Alkalibacterium sp. AK22]